MFISVSVNEQERNNFDGYENNDVVQEIYDSDMNIEHPNSKLCNIKNCNNYEFKKTRKFSFF